MFMCCDLLFLHHQQRDASVDLADKPREARARLLHIALAQGERLGCFQNFVFLFEQGVLFFQRIKELLALLQLLIAVGKYAQLDIKLLDNIVSLCSHDGRGWLLLVLFGIAVARLFLGKNDDMISELSHPLARVTEALLVGAHGITRLAHCIVAEFVLVEYVVYALLHHAIQSLLHK